MKPFFSDEQVTLHHGAAVDVLRTMTDGSVDCCVTSPPYFGLRDYGVDGQQGLEASPAEYVAGMVEVFAEVRRVLADDGTLWLNIGDSYSTGTTGCPPSNTRNRTGHVARTGATIGPKNLLGIPWRLAFALQDDGWILRNDIIWTKPNGMPEAVTDRMSTKHEHIFLFSKRRFYWFDLDPIRVEYDGERSLSRRSRTGHTNKENSAQGAWGIHTDRGRSANGSIASAEGMVGNTNAPTSQIGRNPGDVWTIPTQPFPGAHFAVMPTALAERCIQAGCKPGGTVLDPYSGSGTTGLAAARHGRRYLGIDLNAEYLQLSLDTRLAQAAFLEGQTA